MSDIPDFKSRKGYLDANTADVYHFVTDLRNFEQFVPGSTFSDFYADEEQCSFKAGMLGTVNIRIGEKILNSKVVYTGNALQVNDFSLAFDILNNDNEKTEVRIGLKAGLNPTLKMMASGYIKQFLEIMIDEMEKFRGWNKTRTGNRPL